MDAKICLLAFGVLLAIGELNAQVSHRSGNCPLRNTVSKCTPSCQSDFQCSFNQKCCPNKCGNMSCASASAVNTGDDGGYKGSNRDGGAVICNGVRCGPFEKCQFDRATKRDKCVRT